MILNWICLDCQNDDHDFCDDEECACCGGWFETNREEINVP